MLSENAPPAGAPARELLGVLEKEIANLIDTVYRHCGQKATVIFADQMMQLGFREAAKAGISFGKDDIVIPARKAPIVEETRKLVEEYEQQYADGGGELVMQFLPEKEAAEAEGEDGEVEEEDDDDDDAVDV